MRLLIFLLLIAGLLASCGGNSVPSDIIPKEKMQTIVWQLLQSDEYVNRILAKDSTQKSSVERMRKYEEVFDLNNTSMTEFKKSYQFYMSHPDITKVMFDSITAKALRQRTDFYKPKSDSASGPATMQHIQLEKRKADSIAKAGMRLLNRPKPDSIVAARNNMLRFQIERRRADSLAKADKHPVNLNKIKRDSAASLKFKPVHGDLKTIPVKQ